MAEYQKTEINDAASDGAEISPLQIDEKAGETELTVSPRRAAIRAYWAEIVFATSLGVYTVMAVLAHRYAYFEWDLGLAHFIQSKNTSIPGFKTLMVSISVLGNGWVPVALVVVTGVALLAARFRIEGAICIAGAGLGAAMNSLLKVISGRPRPSAALVQVAGIFEHDSFPSGHVVFFIEYFGFLFFLAYVLLKRGFLRRASLISLGILVALIGVSRVSLGAHWPSDTLGAYLAGGMWLMLMIEVYRRLKSKQRRQE